MEKEKTNWFENRITHIKGLKTPTEQQKMLALLAEKANRTSQEEKYLSALIRAEKANERAAKARTAAATLINDDKKKAKEAERKERTHRLIQQGVLFDLAQLEDRSHAELLGILLAAVTIDDAERRKNWREKGEAKLKELSVGLVTTVDFPAMANFKNKH